MMNICMLSIEYPPVFGGVGQSVQRIARGLRQNGHQVTVIVVPLDGFSQPGLKTVEVDYEEDNGVKIFRPKPILRREDHQRMRVDLVSFEWIGEFIRNDHFDLIHSFYISHTGFIAGMVAQELGLPFVTSIRGNDLHQNLFDPERFEYILWTLEHANAVTYVSQALKDRAHRLADIHCLSQVIWNSINLDDFDPKASVGEEYYSLPKPVIASVGEFRQKKGIERILEAYLGLGRQASLLLVGDFTYRERDFWKSYIAEHLNASDTRIEITGIIPHHQILPYYALADLILLPSLHDGCPNVLIEALLSGIPVIGTDQGAIGDILRQSGAGIVLDPYSKEGLIKHINDLMDQPEIRAQMSRKGRDFAQEHFSLSREISELTQVYEAVLASHP